MTLENGIGTKQVEFHAKSSYTCDWCDTKNDVFHIGSSGTWVFICHKCLMGEIVLGGEQ